MSGGDQGGVGRRPDRVLLCLATYNEMENLPPLLAAIWQQVPDVAVLVIDDNSPDGTGRWCQSQVAAEPRLVCRVRPSKLGLGSATLLGMQEAVEQGYAWLLTMDADFSHPPDVVPGLLAAATDEVDVVLGSRYVPGGGITGWPWSRRWMSRGVNWLARRCLRLPVRDISGALRGYRVSLLQQLLADPPRAQGYAFLEEVLWRLKLRGARFREVPFVFQQRVAGRSKLNWNEAVRALAWILWMGLLERGWAREVPTSRSVR